MKNSIFTLNAIAMILLAGVSDARAEKVYCESDDKTAQFEIRENDPPAEDADWRIARFTRQPYKQTSIYTVERTSRAERVVYASQVNRKDARLDLGVYNVKGEYPEAKLVTYVAGGGFLTTPMTCNLEGKIKFVNDCADKRPAVLGKKMIIAAREGNTEKVENLLGCGAEANFSLNGCNPLLASLDPTCGGAADSWRPFPASGVPELANLLLDSGALIDSQEARTGEATMHKAVRFTAENNELDFLSLLIGLEASVNSQDKRGRTPLMLAVMLENVDIVQALVEGGADISLRDRSGKTAYQYAKAQGFTEALNFLVAPSEIITLQGDDDGKCSPEVITLTSGNLVRFVLKATPEKMFKLDAPQLDLDLMAERGSEIYRNILLSRKGEFAFTCGFHGSNTPTRGKIIVK